MKDTVICSFCQRGDPSCGHTGPVINRAARRRLERENRAQPDVLQPVPSVDWPPTLPDGIKRVWRSRRFLVLEFDAPPPAYCRLTVNRTSQVGGDWVDGITWDELQQLKREAGYGHYDALEVYPADADIVDVANMRHLWVMREPVSFAWRAPR